MNLPIIAVSVAPLFIAASISAAKLAGNSIHPFIVAGLAPLLSVPFLYVWSRLQGTRLSLTALEGRCRRDLCEILVSRCVLGQVLIVSGFILTTATKAVLLLRLEPLFVLCWNVALLSERPSKKKVWLSLLLIVGAFFVVSPQLGTLQLSVGDGLIVLALLLLSYSYIPTKRISSSIDALSLTMITNVLSGILIVLPTGFLLPHELWATLTPKFGYLLLYSLLLFVFGLPLYFYAFKSLAPWLIACFLSLEVVAGLFLAVLLFSEVPTATQLLGAALMIGATVLVARTEMSG